MNDSNRNTNVEPRDEPRHKPHSLAPTAGDVEVSEVVRPKGRRDLLPWVMAISAVATVAAVFAVYETRSPRLFTTELGASSEAASDDDVFEHVGYGALRWRSTSPEVPSDFASHEGADREDETASLGADLVALADSLGDANRRAVDCAGVTSAEDVKMSVTFHPSGYVSWVDVEEGALGREAEDCIEAAVMSTATPSFIGEEMTIQQIFRLR